MNNYDVIFCIILLLLELLMVIPFVLVFLAVLIDFVGKVIRSHGKSIS